MEVEEITLFVLCWGMCKYVNSLVAVRYSGRSELVERRRVLHIPPVHTTRVFVQANPREFEVSSKWLFVQKSA